MSIIEMILEQKVILISVLFALVPLLAALVLFVLSRMRRSSVQRKLRATARTVAVAELAVLQEAERQVMPAKATPPGNQPAPAQPAAPVQPGTGVQPAQPQVPASGAAPQAAAPGAQSSGQPASSGLGDLLSLFGETEDNNDRAVLLDGLDNIEMTRLAALSQEVAERLHALAQ
jgi:hypothetical protein